MDMGLLSWVGKKAVESGSGVERAAALIPLDKEDNDVIVYENRKASGIALSGSRGAVVQVRSKSLKISGEVYEVDPRTLIRMIKQVTQTIGEYKDKNNPYAAYVVSALRKARSDMVSDLEHHFRINWEIDEATGKSIFYMG
jgi:hypothetical protein